MRRVRSPEVVWGMWRQSALRCLTGLSPPGNRCAWMSSLGQPLEDAGHHHVDRLVLPRPDNPPPSTLEGASDQPVARDVSFELGDPVVAVPLGNVAVLRAAMPKAAVDEHGDAPAREDDVGLRRDGGQLEPVVDAEAQAPRVEAASERALGAGVASPVARHAPRHPRVERRGVRRFAHLCRLRLERFGTPTRTRAQGRTRMVLVVSATLQVLLGHVRDWLWRRAVVPQGWNERFLCARTLP